MGNGGSLTQTLIVGAAGASLLTLLVWYFARGRRHDVATVPSSSWDAPALEGPAAAAPPLARAAPSWTPAPAAPTGAAPSFPVALLGLEVKRRERSGVVRVVALSESHGVLWTLIETLGQLQPDGVCRASLSTLIGAWPNFRPARRWIEVLLAELRQVGLVERLDDGGLVVRRPSEPAQLAVPFTEFDEGDGAHSLNACRRSAAPALNEIHRSTGSGDPRSGGSGLNEIHRSTGSVLNECRRSEAPLPVEDLNECRRSEAFPESGGSRARAPSGPISDPVRSEPEHAPARVRMDSAEPKSAHYLEAKRRRAEGLFAPWPDERRAEEKRLREAHQDLVELAHALEALPMPLHGGAKACNRCMELGAWTEKHKYTRKPWGWLFPNHEALAEAMRGHRPPSEAGVPPPGAPSPGAAARAAPADEPTVCPEQPPPEPVTAETAEDRWRGLETLLAMGQREVVAGNVQRAGLATAQAAAVRYELPLLTAFLEQIGGQDAD